MAKDYIGAGFLPANSARVFAVSVDKSRGTVGRAAGPAREVARRMRKLTLPTIVLTASVLTGCAGGIDNDAATEADLRKCAASSTVVHGVDVSGYQGSSINWSAARGAGIAFAFAKASEGTGFTDSSFAHNWSGMRAAGVVRGAYHFFRPAIDC